MKRTLDFLKNAGTFYLATTEGSQPRVRPYGAINEYKGKLYICTNTTKPSYRQMKENPKIEISATVKGDWIRLAGTVAEDTSDGAKKAMLEAYPSLLKIYGAGTPMEKAFTVFYFVDATATFCSFGGKPETVTF